MPCAAGKTCSARRACTISEERARGRDALEGREDGTDVHFVAFADWPGLRQAALHEGRDLKPTLDLEVLIASAVSTHYGLDMARTARALFPDIAATRPVEGLIRA